MNQQLREWFNWWKCQPDDVMEIRLLESPNCSSQDDIFKKVREIGQQTNIPFFGNSFFISTADELIKILTVQNNWVRKLNVYYGVNPRRKIKRYSKQWKNLYDGYGKGYASVKSINFIPLDIENVNRKGSATDEQLKSSLITANDLREYMLEKYGWNNFYKACSGGGHHLVYKLDQPIVVPEFSYTFDSTNETLRYNISENADFNQIKNCVNNFLEKISVQTEKEYECKVDSVGDAPRILRLPFSINWKSSTPFKAEILEKNYDGENINLSNKILEFKTKRKAWEFKPRDPFRRIKTIEELRNEPLTKLLLTPKLPSGNRNHYLELQFALLLRDNGFDLNSPEIIKLVSEIETAQGQAPQLSFQYLDSNTTFSPAVVNKWCEINMWPPAYEVLPNKVIRRKINLPIFKLRELKKEEFKSFSWKMILNEYAKKISKTPPGSIGQQNLLFELNGVLVTEYGAKKSEYIWNNFAKNFLEKWTEEEYDRIKSIE